MCEVKISVITVVYNNLSGIECTIKSVLSQTYYNIEYIIIDGCSTDGTIDVVKKYMDRVSVFVSEKDSGIYDAMNKGITFSTGDYIIFLNSGDEFVNENVITEAITLIDTDCDVVYGSCIQRSDDGFQIVKKPFPIERIKKGPVFRHNAAFFKLKTHREYMFDLSKSDIYGYGLDYNAIFDMYEAGKKFQELNIPIVCYDVHGISANKYYSALYSYRIAHKLKFNFWDWVILQLKLLMYYKDHKR